MTKFYYCTGCEERQANKLCGRCFHQQYCSRECQANHYPRHKIECYPLSKELFYNKKNRILHEALEFNLFLEYQGGKARFDRLGVFDQGRNFVYKGVIGMILMNPVSATRLETFTSSQNEEWDSYIADIKKGFELIRRESNDSVNDPLLWCFIPNTLKQIVQLYS